MSITLKISNKVTLTGKAPEEKILARVTIPDMPKGSKGFMFGRNTETEALWKEIKGSIFSFVSREQGLFRKSPTGSGYLYTDQGSKHGSFLRTKVFFGLFGVREARLLPNDPTSIAVGDKIVIKGVQGHVELILEVVAIS